MLAGRKQRVFLLIVSILCSLSDFHHVKIFFSSLTEFTQWKHFTFFYWMQRKRTRFSRVASVEWDDQLSWSSVVRTCFCRASKFSGSLKQFFEKIPWRKLYSRKVKQFQQFFGEFPACSHRRRSLPSAPSKKQRFQGNLCVRTLLFMFCFDFKLTNIEFRATEEA